MALHAAPLVAVPAARYTAEGDTQVQDRIARSAMLSSSWPSVVLRLLCGEVLLPCLQRREFRRS